MEQKGIRLTLFKPVSQSSSNKPDKTTAIIRAHSNLNVGKSLNLDYVESLLRNSQQNVLMEEILAHYHESTLDNEVVLIEGLVSIRQHQFVNMLNEQIARTLNAKIIHDDGDGE